MITSYSPTCLSRTLMLAAVLSIAALSCGCAKAWNLRGENFPDDNDMSRWGEHNRPPENHGHTFGFSNKSLQIEKNLGIR